jgi:hypothetical protein
MNEASVAFESSIDDHVWFADALKGIVCVLPRLVGYDMVATSQQHRERLH